MNDRAVLSHRTAEGGVFLADGRRVAAWPEVFLQTLHLSLTQEAAGDASHLLYRIGFEWALQDMLQLSERVRDEFGRRPDHTLWKLGDAEAFERWSAPLATAGWGRWKIDRSARASGVTVIELQHSAVAAALGSMPAPADPVCHLYAGLFAGGLSFYERTEVHAVETECVALGHAACRFVVGAGPVVDRAENARRAGSKHDAIVRAALTPPAPAPAAAPAKPGNIPWKK